MFRNQDFSIANQLRYGLVSIVVLTVLITGSTLTYLSFREQAEQTKRLQQERSQAAANKISAYLDNLQRQLNYLSELRGLTDFTPETQRSILEGLVNSNSAYELVGILNNKAQVLQAMSPYEPVSPARLNLALTSADSPLFLQTFKSGQNYVSPVKIDSKIDLPVATLAVPIRNRQNQINGVLFGKINLNFLTQITDRTQVGKTGYSYILDNRLVLIAGGTESQKSKPLPFGNPYSFGERYSSRRASPNANGERGASPVPEVVPAPDAVKSQNPNPQSKIENPESKIETLPDLKDRPFVRDLSKLSLSPRIQPVIVYKGLNGEDVIGTATLVRRVQWMVVVELPTAEAYAPVRWMILVMGGATLVAVVVAVSLGIAFSKSITIPLKSLTAAASRISGGQFDSRVKIAASNELGELATSFNTMAEQLQVSFAQMKALNEELSKSEKRLTQFLEAVPVGVSVHDATGEIFYANHTAQQLMRMSVLPDAKTGQLAEAYHVYLAGTGQIYPIENLPIARALAGESAYADDLELHQADKVVPVEVWTTPILDDMGQVVYAIAAFQDITKRKQAEEAILKAEQRYRSIFENALEGIFQTTPDGRYLSVNPALAHLYGYDSPQELMVAVSDIAHEVYVDPHRRAEFITLMQQHNGVSGFESQVYRKDGNIIWISENARTIRNATGEILYYQGFVVDITERKRTEQLLAEYNQTLERTVEERTQELSQALSNLRATQQELIQSEKMAALGQLVAGVAHEINTPLGAIRSSIGNIADFLTNNLEKLPEFFQTLSKERQQDFLALLSKSIQQSAPLSSKEKRQLKKELKRQLEAQTIDNTDSLASLLLNIGVQDDIQPFLPLLKDPKSEIILKTAYELASVQTSTRTITTATERAAKVVFALKSYARYDYSGEKIQSNIIEGIETVLTLYYNQLKQGVEVIRNYDQVPAILCYADELNQVWTNLVHNALQAMDYKGTLRIDVTQQHSTVRVSITDSGKGIPPEIMQKIFEPFFTTKPTGEGSGLGLDIVKKIVEKHQGKIEFDSVPGKTTFTVSIPVNG